MRNRVTLCFAQEAPPDVGIAAPFRAEFLERDFAIELLVVGQPDLADASFAMHVGQRVSRKRFRGGLRIGNQRLHDDVPAVGPTGERLADVGIVDLLEHIADSAVGNRSQRGVYVADEPLQLPLDLAFEFVAALLRQPLPLDQSAAADGIERLLSVTHARQIAASCARSMYSS